jgi:hypothetical protein
MKKRRSKMGKISQCMIVKNEEKNIERALSWGKEIVSEQIVVDTGSTDRTVELAEKMGAKVYHFEWIDDFAAAKNYAIEQAGGDWIFFLDADEYFNEEDAKKIPALLEKITSGNVMISKLYNLDRNGEIINTIDSARIFRNDGRIHYEGRIHEHIATSKGVLIAVEMPEDLAIFHTGYAYPNGEEERKEKGSRNVRILKKALADSPDSLSLQVYLAESLSLAGDQEGALQYMLLALKNKSYASMGQKEQTRIYRDMLYLFLEVYRGREEQEETLLQHYEEAVAVNDTFPDYDIVLGYWMYALQKNGQAISYFQKVLEKLENASSLEDSLVIGHLCEIYELLAVLYHKEEDLNRCIYYAVLSLQINAYQDDLIEAVLYYLESKEHAGPEQMIAFLQQIYHPDKQKDVIYLLKMAVRVRNADLAERLKGYLTEENKSQLFPD